MQSRQAHQRGPSLARAEVALVLRLNFRLPAASTAFASAAAAALASAAAAAVAAAAAAAITSARTASAARLAVHGPVLRVDAALPGVGLLTLPADLDREGALRASGLLVAGFLRRVRLPRRAAGQAPALVPLRALPGDGLLLAPADLHRERARRLIGLLLARGHPGVLLHRHLARQAFAPERLAADPGVGLAVLHERALVGVLLVLARFHPRMRRRRLLAVRIVARGCGALPSNGPRRHLALGRVRVRAVVADGVILAHGHRRVGPR